MVVLPWLAFYLAAPGEELRVEAERYDRCGPALMPPYIGRRETASGGLLVAVCAAETGRPGWLEVDLTVPAGLYELTLRVGGNDSRQAGLVSIDGGPPVTVLDEPSDPLPLDGPAPADRAERSRRLEDTFREHRVGQVRLSAGRHRIRVAHAGLDGRSNSFGVDRLVLTAVEASDAPVLVAGTRPEPEEGTRNEQPQPVELQLLTAYRFWGPHEIACAAVVVRNRERSEPVGGPLAIDLVAADGARSNVAELTVPPLAAGEVWTRRLDLDLRDRPRGSYQLVARLPAAGLEDRAECELAELDTPAWVKRARVLWVGFSLASNPDRAADRVREVAASGINVMVNANVGDWLGEEAISYPFRGDDAGFRRFLAAIHEVGGYHLMYHTMVTVSEHFYYEHQAFWGGRKPYYHCSWLSIYPDSPEWNAWQARDFESAIRRFPLDGIFLDNACASGAPGARSPAGEAAIARHQSGLRAAIKRANPIGILYPNYNTLTPSGLRTVAAAWDAHMLEGAHPVPSQHRQGQGWSVEDFVTIAQRVRQLTGKPFWPLMYAPNRYHGLCVAACGAAGANPVGVVEPSYLRFSADLQEYLYGDDVFLLPAGAVRLAEADPDLAVTTSLRRPPAADEPGAPEWVIQVVNGTENEGALADRDVELRLDLPAAELARPAWLLRPEAPEPEPLRLGPILRLRAGVWTVIVIGDLPPRVSVEPPGIAPVPGERQLLRVAVSGPPAATLGPIEVVEPKSWSTGPAPVRDGVAQLVLAPPADTPPVNHELLLRCRYGQRSVTWPFAARVQPRVDAALRPDHFPVIRETAGTTTLVVTNNTSQTVDGKLRFAAPERWTVAADREELTLAPGASAEVALRLTWPEFRPRSLYDLCDADLGVELTADEPQRWSLPIRLHMPATWVIYCPLGTRPRDVVRTGATPGGGLLSQIVMTVRGHPEVVDDARHAVSLAIERQQAGQQRVVLWFRTGGGGSDQLAAPELATDLAHLLALGGGVIFQENLFRDSPANRSLLASDICPIGEPYEAREEPGGDWTMTAPDHPAVVSFARYALRDAQWGIPDAAQPPDVTCTVKPWARVVAVNRLGHPALVVSADPQRPVAYLAGSLEGTYMNDRQGVGDYPEQMAHLLYFYAELARWLSIFGTGAEPQ